MNIGYVFKSMMLIILLTGTIYYFSVAPLSAVPRTSIFILLTTMLAFTEIRRSKNEKNIERFFK